MARLTRMTPGMINDYIARGYWGTERTSDIWDRNARANPDGEALVDSRKRLTWGQVKTHSDRLALWLLERGFRHDDMIVMQLPNCVESFIVRLACEKAGVLCAPAQMNFRYREMASVCQHARPVAAVTLRKARGFDFLGMMAEIQRETPALKHILLTGDDVPSGFESVEEILARPLEREYPEGYLKRFGFDITEAAVIGVTSGTTGVPKLIEHPILARIAGGNFYGRKVKIARDDTLALVNNSILGGGAPMGYNGAAPYVGARMVLLESWDAEAALRLIQAEEVTILQAVPTQLIQIVTHPALCSYDVGSLRAVHTGTSALSCEMAIETERKLGARVVIAYGAFDGGIFSCGDIEDPQDVRCGTVGRPPEENELKIVDDEGRELPAGETGEVWVRGAITQSGTYRDPEATIQAWGCLGENGWFRTGDLATRDTCGNVRVVGRKKDVVVRGGQNIYAVEIENLLLHHPKIAQAAIVGMPDPVLGERACAYVALKPGERLSFDEMVSFLRAQQIASYKLPERLEVWDSLPCGDLGKVGKEPLRADVRRKLEAEGALESPKRQPDCS